MTLLTGGVWTIVDDDGSGNTGTPGNAAWVAALKASIEALIHSTVNTAVTPEDVIDEVITARDIHASLDARFDDLETSVGAISISNSNLQAILGQGNLAFNELFEVWHAGDTAAPAGWTLAGAGGTIQRTGNGLVDTQRKIGDFAARIRRVAATTTLEQAVLDALAFAKVEDAFRNRYVGFGAYVRSTSVGGGRIYITDGAGTTFSAANSNANFWEWLSVERLVDAGATGLSIGVTNDLNGADVYFSVPTFSLTAQSAPPSKWFPSPVEYHQDILVIPGTLTTGQKRIWMPPRPGIVRSIQGAVVTAPTGADLKIDINTWDGAAYTSMLTAGTVLTITAGSNIGSTVPTAGTYARRCFRLGSISANAGVRFSLDIDQIGSGTAGADLVVSVFSVVPNRLLEGAYNYDDEGL